ncbi:YihY/virulence factor BrkB family protein [Chitinophagaceae bacterium LWZ2-11]
MKFTLKNIWGVIKETVEEFSNDRGTKLSAALSYYTIFSIAPMLFIVISFASIFWGHDAVQGKLFLEIRKLVGDNAAEQIQQMLASTQLKDNTFLGAAIGIVVLVFGATGVFAEIQDSINFIWSVKAKPKKGWVKYIVNRVISFSLVVAMGFILMVSLVANALMEVLSERMSHIFSDSTFYIVYCTNLFFLFFFIMILFAVIFKVLPDVKIRWKDAFVGASVTSFLFMIGKFLIGYYLGNTKTSAIYGAAASLVIVLLWVYYTSFILYFGAEFTKVYTLRKGFGIRPNDNAVYILKQEQKELTRPKEL